MNKRTVICCLFALCNTIAVLAAPTIDSATTTTAECINNDSTRRIWTDFSVIGRYINPFDWIGKPVISKPKRYDWALEKDTSNRWWIAIYEEGKMDNAEGRKYALKIF